MFFKVWSLICMYFKVCLWYFWFEIFIFLINLTLFNNSFEIFIFLINLSLFNMKVEHKMEERWVNCFYQAKIRWKQFHSWLRQTIFPRKKIPDRNSERKKKTTKTITNDACTKGGIQNKVLKQYQITDI